MTSSTSCDWSSTPCLGSGERLFRETSDMKPVRLVDARTVGEGLSLLVYRPIRDA